MRAMMFLLTRNLFTLLALVASTEVYDAAENYLNKGGPVGAESAR